MPENVSQVPAPQVMPAPTVAQPPASAAQAAVAQTATPNGLDFLSGINWIETGMLFLGALALYSTVNYYRLRVKDDKTSYYDVQRQVDKLNQRTTATEAIINDFAQQIRG